MSRLEQQLAAALRERELTGNLRRLTTRRAAVDFYSNDYLGLATNGVITRMVQERYPEAGNAGATGSRLLSGNSAEAEELEAFIAAFHHAEAALLFNSGYDANIGLITAITQRHTTILYDELCHASIIDGVRLSLCAAKYKFRHNDLNDLEERLMKCTDASSVLVFAEAVYSMDGDQAPLPQLAGLCKRYDAQLIVDEAHATGIFGLHGEGLVVANGLEQSVFARVHTFGKALGCQGAVVVGSSLLRRYLINFARSFIYTTAAPPHAISAASSAYHYLASNPDAARPLHELIDYFKAQIAARGLIGWQQSESAIQVYLQPAGETTSVTAIAQKMQQAGLQVNAILHPTVPRGRERLRVCLHAFNTRAEVDELLRV